MEKGSQGSKEESNERKAQTPTDTFTPYYHSPGRGSEVTLALHKEVEMNQTG